MFSVGQPNRKIDRTEEIFKKKTEPKTDRKNFQKKTEPKTEPTFF
jgi:hypothetical protein